MAAEIRDFIEGTIATLKYVQGGGIQANQPDPAGNLPCKRRSRHARGSNCDTGHSLEEYLDIPTFVRKGIKLNL